MAISIAYGIAIATVLTLVLLPVGLSLVNSLKTNTQWLITGKHVPKEDVERAIKEQKEVEDYDEAKNHFFDNYFFGFFVFANLKNIDQSRSCRIGFTTKF